MSSHNKKTLLNRMSKRASQHPHASDEKSGDFGLKDQYEVIREDLMKLRNDVQKGYDMARGMLDRRKLMDLLKTR